MQATATDSATLPLSPDLAPPPAPVERVRGHVVHTVGAGRLARLLATFRLLALGKWAFRSKLPVPSQQYLGGVERNPRVWGGAAVLSGTRIPVFVLEDCFRQEGSVENVLAAYPELTRADVWYALAFAQSDRKAVEGDRSHYLAKIPPEHRI